MKHSRGLVIGISNVCQLTADNRCWPGRRSPRCQPRTHQNSPVKKKLAPGYHRVSFSLNRQLLPAWGAAAAPRKPRNSYHFCSSFSTPPNALSLPCKCVTIDKLPEWRSAATEQNPENTNPECTWKGLFFSKAYMPVRFSDLARDGRKNSPDLLQERQRLVDLIRSRHQIAKCHCTVCCPFPRRTWPTWAS